MGYRKVPWPREVGTDVWEEEDLEGSSHQPVLCVEVRLGVRLNRPKS